MFVSGSMKTYWLEKREERSQMSKGIAIHDPPQWHNRAIEKRMSIGVVGSGTRGSERNFEKTTSASARTSRVSSPAPTNSSGHFLPEDRRIYSPITFQDVARRSVANSPIKSIDHKGK